MDQRTLPLLFGGFRERKQEVARNAYLNKDADASRHAHLTCSTVRAGHIHTEGHVTTSSEYLKCLVFGGLDGIVTIFAIVAGCVGTHLSPIQTLIVGIGNLLADATSMGFGEYVGSKTEADYIRSEKARESWEVENYPEGEKREMMEIYEKKYGFTHEDAQTMVDICFKYNDFCISHMMAEELGLLVTDECPSPLKKGGVMFGAFVLFGLVPLVGFALVSWVTLGNMTSKPSKQLDGFWAATVLSCVTLFTLGAIKAQFLHQSSFKSGSQMVLNGAFAGFVAFGVGATLQQLLGESLV